MIRLAAVQFATTTDVDANLATCLRMLDQVAAHRPDLVVTPEFCNRLSWYASKEEAWEFAVEEDGAFLQAVAAKAQEHQMHVVVNVTVKRVYPRITITSFLFGPEGNKIMHADKQTLMGRENLFFDRAEELAPLAETAIGRLGLLMCRDGVTMETPRGLAVRGAQILCNSLNSFALDEASLHIPVRAPENKVFVVAANKVGPLIPLDQLEAAAARLGVPAHILYGAGESQIVAPDGTVLVKAPMHEETSIFADITLSQADDKRRPSGTHIFHARRPALYQEIAEAPVPLSEHPRAEAIKVAVYQPASEENPVEGILQAIQDSAAQNVSLLVLPERIGITSPHNLTQSEQLTAAIQNALTGSALCVCTSLSMPDSSNGYTHTGVLISSQGIILQQPQLHPSHAHPWSTPGDSLHTVDMPWGRVGILVGEDSIYPEAAKVLAIRGVDVIAIPFDAQENWELTLGLVDRSAENRVCVVAATRPKPFGGSLIITQWKDFQIFTPWAERAFTGTINEPIVHRAPPTPGVFVQEIHPATAQYKMMSYQTDLIQGRPWTMCGPLTQS
ncbi:MAG TPA: carbon-nitrogen hydrolase family protein [Anaerolineales bacterium]|nr:carbon-nitrogen hydrolase family protein [Anaerolineales bacterium]